MLIEQMSTLSALSHLSQGVLHVVRRACTSIHLTRKTVLLSQAVRFAGG